MKVMIDVVFGCVELHAIPMCYMRWLIWWGGCDVCGSSVYGMSCGVCGGVLGGACACACACACGEYACLCGVK